MSPRDTIEQSASPPARPGVSRRTKPRTPGIGLRGFFADNTTSLDSLQAAQDQVDEVGQRRVDIPVRKSFVRSWDEETPAPLASIYVGGQSGLVAVKLYLALLWRCARTPYETDKPARAWATLLDLPDPNTRGARRVANAMKALRQAKLLAISAQAGHPNMVTLAMEDGSGHAYSPPATAYQFARNEEQKKRHMYFKVARELWLDGTIQALPGPALVMLLILLAERADKEPQWFSTTAFPRRYRISHKTRAEGTRQLVARGLLTTDRETLASSRNASVYDEVRKRTLYRLTERTFTGPSTETGDTSAGEAALALRPRPAVAVRTAGFLFGGQGPKR